MQEGCMEFEKKPTILTVGQLMRVLSEFDPNMLIAGYSREGECDFHIDCVAVAQLKTDGIKGFYCQGGSHFGGDGERVVVIAGGSR